MQLIAGGPPLGAAAVAVAAGPGAGAAGAWLRYPLVVVWQEQGGWQEE